MSFEQKAITSAGLISISDFIARCLSFISLPILTSLLAPSEYGVAALIASIISFGTTLSIFGIDLGYSRLYLANNKNEKSKAIESFSWIFVLRNTFIYGILLAILWHFFGERFIENNNIALSVYIFAMVIISSTQIILQTRSRLIEDYKRVAVVKIISTILSISISIYLAFYVFQSFWVLLLGSMVLSVLMISNLKYPDRSILSFKIKEEDKKSLVKLGYINFITALMYWIITSTDKWFLSIYVDQSLVGIYSLAANIAVIGLLLSGGITLAWMPEASRAYHDKKNFKESDLGKILERFVMILLIIWLAVTMSGSEILMLLANERFHEGVVFIPVLAGGFFFYSLATIFNTAQMLKIKLNSVVLFYILGAALNIIMNFMFIPKFGAMAAAISQMISFSFIAGGVFFYSRKIMLIPMRWLRLAMIIIITLLVGIYLREPLTESLLFSLFIKFPIGILVACTFIVIISPDWINKMREVIFSKT